MLTPLSLRYLDAVFAGKSLSVVERTASNVIFTDLKDRLLKIPPQSLFGAYYGSFNSSSHRLPTEDSRAMATAASVTSALMSAASLGSGSGENSWGESASLAPQSAGKAKYAIFSPIITQPMQQLLAEELFAKPKVLPLAATVEADEQVSKKGRASSGGRKKDNRDDSKPTSTATSASVAASVSTLTEDEAALSDAVAPLAAPVVEEPALRVSKQRGASSDKVELRRKWLSVAQRASHCLGQSSSNGHSASNSTGKATLAEAQSLLDFACSLPPHHTIMSLSGSSVVSSSTAAGMSTAAVAIATEEAALLDNVSVLLGKLVKVLLRDSCVSIILYLCAYNMCRLNITAGDLDHSVLGVRSEGRHLLLFFRVRIVLFLYFVFPSALFESHYYPCF